jgi:hypothetical protein
MNRQEDAAQMQAPELAPRLRKALADCWPEDSSSDDLDLVLYDNELDPEAIAGYDRRKVAAALSMVRDDDAGRKLVSGLVRLLYELGLFESEDDRALGRLERLGKAFEASGAELSSFGKVTWESDASSTIPRNPDPIEAARPTPSAQMLQGFLSKKSPQTPDPLDLLEQVLMSVPNAAHPLTHKRHSGRQVVTVDDEYDWQDLAYFALRLVFPDVIAEDPAPKWGDKSSRIDFKIPNLKTVVELKYARNGNHAAIAEQVAADLTLYGSRENYPDLRHIIFMIYDEGGTIRNVEGLKREAESARPSNGATVRLLRQDVLAGLTKSSP